MKKLLFIVVILSLFGVISCKDGITNAENEATFLPLKIGNKWEYKSESYNGDGTYGWEFKGEEELEIISIENDSTFAFLCILNGTETAYVFNQVDEIRSINNEKYKYDIKLESGNKNS